MNSAEIGNLVFHHNSGYSGDILVSRMDDDRQWPPVGRVTFAVLMTALLSGSPLTVPADGEVIEVPVELLRELAGQRLIGEEIEVLEQLTGAQALDGAGCVTAGQRLDKVREWQLGEDD